MYYFIYAARMWVCVNAVRVGKNVKLPTNTKTRHIPREKREFPESFALAEPLNPELCIVQALGLA
jgi:hypothetical protein